MKQILLMIALVALVGCGEFREGFKKGVDRQKKAAEAKAAAEKKAAEASKPPQQTKAKSEKLIADPIVEKAVRKELEKPEGELTEADLGKVTTLDLRLTKITDEGLKEVAKLQQLEELYLTDTKVTDEGLKEVAKLQKLTSLFLTATQITDARAAELQKALPKCKILHSYKAD